LNDVVDYFVIVESTHTFVGQEKPLYYNENKHLFTEFGEKIIHIIVDDFPYKYPNISIPKSEQWKNETFQRNAISRGIERIDGLSNSDIIVISDLDEIPDPHRLLQLKQIEIIVDIYSLSMDFYYYNLNTRFNSKWTLSKIVSYKKYKDSGLSCNNIRHVNAKCILKGGWHLSYFGDASFIKNKINSFSHQEYNNEKYTSLSKIEERVNGARDLFDRGNLEKIEIGNNQYLPPLYETLLSKYY